MRRTVLATTAMAALTLLVAACGSSTSSAPSGGSTSSSPAASTGASAASGKFLACMVTDTGGIDDRSFNASSWQGVTQAESSSITGKYLQSTSASDYTPNINTFVGQKCGIIVTVGFLMGDATQTAAKANASQKFAIVDYNYVPPLKNVDALLFNTVQDGFLGGYLAAGMSKTGKVATFGGQQLPTVSIYMDGFYDGVQYYNSKHHTKVQVLGWNETTQKGSFTGDFTNQTKGQNLTQTLITEGADIIFPVAGNVGLGAAKAVQDADTAAGSQKVNMLWVDGGEERDHDRGRRHVRRRQLHRHLVQRRGGPVPVPRLRGQGLGLTAVRAGHGEGGHRGRQHQDADQEPGIAITGIGPTSARSRRAG